MKKKIFVLLIGLFLLAAAASASQKNQDETTLKVFQTFLKSAQMVAEKTDDAEAKSLLNYFTRRAVPVKFVGRDGKPLIDVKFSDIISSQAIPVVILFEEDERQNPALELFFRILRKGKAQATYVTNEEAEDKGRDFILLRGELGKANYESGIILLHEIKHFFMARDNQPEIPSVFPGETEAYELQSRLFLKLGGPDLERLAEFYTDMFVRKVESTSSPLKIKTMCYLTPYYRPDWGKIFDNVYLGNQDELIFNFSVLVNFRANQRIFSKAGLSESEISLRQAMSISKRLKKIGQKTTLE